jgi:hypothetical protein
MPTGQEHLRRLGQPVKLVEDNRRAETPARSPQRLVGVPRQNNNKNVRPASSDMLEHFDSAAIR